MATISVQKGKLQVSKNKRGVDGEEIATPEEMDSSAMSEVPVMASEAQAGNGSFGVYAILALIATLLIAGAIVMQAIEFSAM